MMKDKWNNFKSSEMKFFEDLKSKEYKSLFNRDLKDEIESPVQKFINGASVASHEETIGEKIKKGKTKDAKILTQIG